MDATERWWCSECSWLNAPGEHCAHYGMRFHGRVVRDLVVRCKVVPDAERAARTEEYQRRAEAKEDIFPES